MKGEKAPLSPVSEAIDEDDFDGGIMMYDVAEVGVPSVCEEPSLMIHDGHVYKGKL